MTGRRRTASKVRSQAMGSRSARGSFIAFDTHPRSSKLVGLPSTARVRATMARYTACIRLWSTSMPNWFHVRNPIGGVSASPLSRAAAGHDSISDSSKHTARAQRCLAAAQRALAVGIGATAARAIAPCPANTPFKRGAVKAAAAMLSEKCFCVLRCMRVILLYW